MTELNYSSPMGPKVVITRTRKIRPASQVVQRGRPMAHAVRPLWLIPAVSLAAGTLLGMPAASATRPPLTAANTSAWHGAVYTSVSQLAVTQTSVPGPAASQTPVSQTAASQTSAPPPAGPQPSTTAKAPALTDVGVSPEEDKIGKQGVKEVEEVYNVVNDPVTTAKLESMVALLEKATPYPDLKYTVKIVTLKKPLPEPEINAFSLPGGYIYVTKDLLNSIESDDELAAVLGHEMGHVVHHHVIKQIKARKHDETISLMTMLAALIANQMSPNSGSASIAIMSPQVVQALQSPRSIEDETEADMSGIQYLHSTGKYNPTGMLTFMERLAQDETHHPDVEWGYLQDHPSSSHRVEDIEERLRELNVPIDTRAVSHVLTAAPAAAGSGVILRTTFNKKQIDVVTFFDTSEGSDLKARAQAASSAINKCIDDNVPMGLIATTATPAGTVIYWDRVALFTITPADAAASGQSVDLEARVAIQRLKQALNFYLDSRK